jgi:ribonuclease HIII
MSNKREFFLGEFHKFAQQKNWQIISEKDIEFARQIIVTDGTVRLPVNFYDTGKILTQGKPCDTKSAITEWANLIQSGITFPNPVQEVVRQNRISKYLVLPENREKIRQVVLGLEGEVHEREVTGLAEVYRIENRVEGNRVTITQFDSGTLMVQGLSSTLFDNVCEIFDQHLIQSLTERANRFLPGDNERSTVSAYLEQPEAENESAKWLLQQLDKEVLEFLYDNDNRTLLAASGVRNAFEKAPEKLPDYSVVVMPFAKPFEGFLMRLAIHLELTSEDILAKKANEIEVGDWIIQIKDRLPDKKRYGEIATALEAAWSCRNKAVHSDAFHPISVLKSFAEAEHEIGAILRAIARAYIVFVKEKIKLLPPAKEGKPKIAQSTDKTFTFDNVKRNELGARLQYDGYSVAVQEEGRRHEWEVMAKPDLVVIAPREFANRIIVSGKDTEAFCEKYKTLLMSEAVPEVQKRIGVDESGKGDIFGPLVVAGVVVDPTTELLLAKRGIKDSKELSDGVILELAKIIRENCPVEVLALLPQEYNDLYKQFNNLNRLLAWGHAQVITKLNGKEKVSKAISDQFGEDALLVEALKKENCLIPLEQKTHAESDIAVAAASIIARSEFILAMRDYTAKSGLDIPLGASAAQIKEIGRQILKRWGEKGLERIAKMHFKTVQEILTEAK